MRHGLAYGSFELVVAELLNVAARLAVALEESSCSVRPIPARRCPTELGQAVRHIAGEPGLAGCCAGRAPRCALVLYASPRRAGRAGGTVVPVVAGGVMGPSRQIHGEHPGACAGPSREAERPRGVLL